MDINFIFILTRERDGLTLLFFYNISEKYTLLYFVSFISHSLDRLLSDNVMRGEKFTVLYHIHATVATSAAVEAAARVSK